MTTRRALITGLVAGAAWPLEAIGQQSERIRRVGVLMNLAADDADSPARVAAFQQELQGLGWIEGQNVRIDYRWSAGHADKSRAHAAELVALAPDVVVASGTLSAVALRQESRIVPMVFVALVDPVGGGLVESLARPGGNTTGFTLFEYGMSGKWVELLKQAAPTIVRAVVIRDPANPSGTAQLGAIQAVAPLFGVEIVPADVRQPVDIERTLTAFSHASKTGLIVTASALATFHRDLITGLATRNRLPAVYSDRLFITRGGLISYGPNRVDHYRRAAHYVSRIFRGEKPANLPVQAPTKYELVINLNTAKALGLEIAPTLIARADEVIE